MKATYEALAAALREAADNIVFAVESADRSNIYDDEGDVSNDIASALVLALAAAKAANYDIVCLAQQAEDGDF